LRYLFVGCYIVSLFLFTCTESLSLLISQQVVSFQFNSSPNLSDLLINDLSSIQDITYVIQKIGHVISFFFLAVFVYWAWRKFHLIVVFTFVVAFSTEVAQLFFSRSGRLLDVLYDVVGALLFVFLYVSYRFMEWVYRKVTYDVVNRQ
jgi:VanZ family protein